MLADHQGTIRDLVDGLLGSPTEGEVVNHLTYDAYGQLLDQTASDPAFQTRYGYTGQELDAETGLMYYNARWYDPRNGRFISEDPIGINGGDYNLSRYVGNSPTNGTDPSGLNWLSQLILLFSGEGERARQLDDALADYRMRKALQGGVFELADNFRKIQTTGADTAADTMRGLAEGCVVANAAILGGGFVSPSATSGRLAPGVGGQFHDAASRVNLRGLTLNSGTTQLKKAGLTRVRQVDGSFDFIDSAGKVRARWAPRSGQEPAHWSKFEPSGNQKHYLDNSGRPVTGSDRSHRISCR